MSIRTVIHLNFEGNARAALGFYHDVFKGEQTLITYAQAGRAQDAGDPNHIVWGQVTGEDGIALMAYDVQAGLDWHPGDKAFFVSLRGDDAETIHSLWDGLTDGAVVVQALTPSQWSPLYGMLRDRFGVTWVVDVSVPYPPA
ncbi:MULTISPECIES: glyoxalase/bleomycin resistance/extradiol dioxygenase family protein [Burkholderiaceae]|uniref:PhnB protein, putative DNA binding 3-demethylubiquinone-9 3-methyltransferase protein n=1 Tax=Caballeronia sordidicola TaxID=196367 RepID=A0A242ML52_CABSO|nr:MULTISPECIES: glyoxalase/bleomycin resistance/extradiol dioxygenase family protein [Burkholderiaceae]AME28338.1 bleomycin resistance protein [Burkholderia sp. PAMC 26561]OTP68508.1 PhnB protein, putative DNA binding 3-demethylubiquinone-9 3-methyltransferase protein [Caballeronia sordidicola]OTP72030.1 PhnB protein/ putative DNA binding 3-demethylubiquinone-9 3-methyltransferase domain protein [Caballeronia sordidicola]